MAAQTMEKPNIEIEGTRVFSDGKPYVIAELSANHNEDFEKAKELVLQAKNAGADAVKLQTYTPDTITLNSSGSDFQIKDGLWAGQSLYELYRKAHMPWEWQRELFLFAREIGITIFSSPFDRTAVDFLTELDCPAFKVASFEIIDIPLIEYIASTGKPMIISTGMADKIEIGEAIDAAFKAGAEDIAILHCVSGYPAPVQDYNLATIKDMQKRFGLVTGLSDHTLDNTAAICSVALGASIIEKHFTLDRSQGGPDDDFSLEPSEFKKLCDEVKVAWEAVGVVDYGLKSSEVGNIKFRRSLYFVNDLSAGDKITANDIKSVRPGYGMPPKYTSQLIGSEVTQSVKKNTPVRSELIKFEASG